jgi:hypothetical protein
MSVKKPGHNRRAIRDLTRQGVCRSGPPRQADKKAKALDPHLGVYDRTEFLRGSKTRMDAATRKSRRVQRENL